jgi:hypothetical protein
MVSRTPEAALEASIKMSTWPHPDEASRIVRTCQVCGQEMILPYYSNNTRYCDEHKTRTIHGGRIGGRGRKP